jgi:hypothetical protein
MKTLPSLWKRFDDWQYKCGKIVIKAGRSQLEPFGVFLLIKRRSSFLTSYSMLYLYLLFCDRVLYICTCVYVMSGSLFKVI